ncbi:MAG: ABC transporter substrate-binding protein, partial [Burkholderiaceae bacterium]
MLRHLNPLSMVKKIGLYALLSGAAWSFSAAAEPGVTADTITLGQTTDLSGPVADLGLEFGKGYKVFFDALNARGGVHGRKIVVVAQDDAYN